MIDSPAAVPFPVFDAITAALAVLREDDEWNALAALVLNDLGVQMFSNDLTAGVLAYKSGMRPRETAAAFAGAIYQDIADVRYHEWWNPGNARPEAAAFVTSLRAGNGWTESVMEVGDLVAYHARFYRKALPHETVVLPEVRHVGQEILTADVCTTIYHRALAYFETGRRSR